MDVGIQWRREGTAVVVSAMVLLAATSVRAQSDIETDGGSSSGTASGGVVTTVTTLGAITTVGGGIALTLLISDSSSDSKEAYIRQNALALQQDLTLGGGQAVDDLAAAFRIDERNLERFGRMLRHRRDELLPLTDIERLDERRADRFFGLIANGMQQDPRLRRELGEIAHPI